MDSLADCLSIRDVEDALGNLSQKINETYDQAMKRIENLSVNRRNTVKRLLLWVSYAKRPLTVAELEHATVIGRGDRSINEEHIVKLIMSLSAGLIVIDENETVRFVHKTVEDYFALNRSSLWPNGNLELAECCLGYLQLTSFQSGPCIGPDGSVPFNARLKEYPFLKYAASYWGDYARECRSERITPQTLNFLRDKQLLESSIQVLCYTDE